MTSPNDIMFYRSLSVAAVPMLFICLITPPYFFKVGTVTVEAAIQEDLYALIDDLFTSYKNEVRPIGSSETTDVNLGVYVFSINNLDEKSQVLETSIMIWALWEDINLSWNASNYGGVESFTYPQNRVWLPDIRVHNSAKTKSQMGYDQNLIRVYAEGYVYWGASLVTKTSCDIDVTYYPFDTQSCSIIVNTWMTNSDEVFIWVDSAQANETLDYFTPSGTWEIISHEIGAEFIDLDRDISLVYTMKLKRRRTYYVVNIILPVLFLSFTASMVFFLPADAGEKIGMGITVLLAFAVYLTIIADNMPQTSLQVSYLAVYLTLLLGLTAMGVVLAVVVLHIHHKPDDCKIGKRTERVTRKFRKMLGMHSTGGEAEIDFRNQASPKRKCSSSQMIFKTSVTPFNDDDESSRPPSYRENKEKITWPKVAEVVDRIMFFVTSSLIAIITLVFFLLLAMGE